MAKTVFVPETTVTSAWLNAVNNPVRDDQDLDGHVGYVKDTDMDPAPTSLYPQWVTFRDMLAVSVSAGLTITWTPGVVSLPDSSVATVATGTISLPASTTSFIYVSSTGVVVSSTFLPVLALPIARVVTDAAAVSTITDLRPRFQVLPIARAIKTFGASGDQGDVTISADTTLSEGIYYYRNFTVNAGVTLTISRGARIFCSRDCTINGTIDVTTLNKGGNGFGTDSPYNIGGNTGLGPGGGSSNTSGNTYGFGIFTGGSGGAAGFGRSAGTVTDQVGIAQGGAGGGALLIECAGILTVTGTIRANGGNGAVAVAESGTIVGSGGGGGSGGLISLNSLTAITVTNTATLQVIGGNGGNGFSNWSTWKAAGGGGGGGGYIVFQSPNNNATGAVITLSGGTAGIEGGTGTAKLGAGGGGSYAGSGGNSSVNGAAGSLILRTAVPVGI